MSESNPLSHGDEVEVFLLNPAGRTEGISRRGVITDVFTLIDSHGEVAGKAYQVRLESVSVRVFDTSIRRRS